MVQDLFQKFETGTLTQGGQHTDLASRSWNKHKDFDGVFLKNVVTAEQTGGLLTCNLVRIEPNHKIGMHTHPASIELHEVIQGSGTCLIDQTRIPYSPGSMGIVACNEPHEVEAGEEGLCLFAKFITAPA